MPTVIKPKRSEVASSIPSSGSLAVGEIAMNVTDGKFYTKTSGGTVKEMGGAGSVTLQNVVTNGSVVGRKKTVFEMMQPINRDNIIYGFHYYGHGKIKWGDFTLLRKNVATNTSSWDNHLTKSLNEITSFKGLYSVPVMLTEVGLIGTSKYVYTGVKNRDRARIFGEIIVPWVKSCKCGLTWWALGDDMTPYVRKRDKSSGLVEYNRPNEYRPPKNAFLIRDELLMKALGLNDYFIFKKKKLRT